MKQKVLLTGGGSAGHVTPNLALVPYLQERGIEVAYIGTKNGIEREIVGKTDLPYYGISAGKLRRYFSLKNFTDPFRILAGYRQAKKILKDLQPDLVFSKGGFVTVPVAFAASKLGIPVLLHESDYTPGLANRLAMPKATKVLVSFESALAHIEGNKGVLTGSPVRQELFTGSKNRGLEFLGFSGKKPVLLIMGGSLGAAAINDAVDQTIDQLLERFQIVHIRGNGKLNSALDKKEGYRQFEYVDTQLKDIFAACDFMLSRAGANAIFELLALGKPALLIPLPKEQSRGDQILNANYFAKKGFSLVLMQEDLNSQTLLSYLDQLVQKRAELIRNMRSSGMDNGTQNVLNQIYEILGEGK